MKTVDRIRLEHRPQVRQYQAVADDQRNWRQIQADGITFTWRPHTSPKLITNSFNRQFTTSKLGKHSSSRRTRHVSKDVRWMSLEEAESFTSDQVGEAEHTALTLSASSTWRT